VRQFDPANQNSAEAERHFKCNFTIFDRVEFQFRGEATNVFNFVNLSGPGGTMSSTSSFGVISGAASMRVLQVGGRILL
jgi:hypothetical protein